MMKIGDKVDDIEGGDDDDDNGSSYFAEAIQRDAEALAMGRAYFDGLLTNVTLYDEEIFINYSLDGSGPWYSETNYQPVYQFAVGALVISVAIAAYLYCRRPVDRKGEYTVLLEKV